MTYRCRKNLQAAGIHAVHRAKWGVAHAERPDTAVLAEKCWFLFVMSAFVISPWIESGSRRTCFVRASAREAALFSLQVRTGPLNPVHY